MSVGLIRARKLGVSSVDQPEVGDSVFFGSSLFSSGAGKYTCTVSHNRHIQPIAPFFLLNNSPPVEPNDDRRVKGCGK